MTICASTVGAKRTTSRGSGAGMAGDGGAATAPAGGADGGGPGLAGGGGALAYESGAGGGAVVGSAEANGTAGGAGGTSANRAAIFATTRSAATPPTIAMVSPRGS